MNEDYNINDPQSREGEDRISCRECDGELMVIMVEKNWSEFHIDEDTGELSEPYSGDQIGIDWDTALVFCTHEDEHVTGYVYDKTTKKVIEDPNPAPPCGCHDCDRSYGPDAVCQCNKGE